MEYKRRRVFGMYLDKGFRNSYNKPIEEIIEFTALSKEEIEKLK